MSARMTEAQRAELEAIALTERDLGRPTSLHRSLYRDPELGPLYRSKLVKWDPHSPHAWGPAFAAVSLTPAGRTALDQTRTEGER